MQKNKSYFAKYLPVEGEIKEGELVTDNHGIFPYHKGNPCQGVFGNFKKVKLFLCSRDIQVGDKVVYEAHLDFGVQLVTNIEDDEVAVLSKGSKTHAHNLLKVIGEISPEATWVKEGDEFDEDEWRFVVYDFDITPIILPKNRKYDKKKDVFNLEIKGPCGHFH